MHNHRFWLSRIRFAGLPAFLFLLMSVLFFCTKLSGQDSTKKKLVHFTKFKRLKFREVKMDTIRNNGVDTQSEVKFKNIAGLDQVRIQFVEIDTGVVIRVYQSGKLLKDFSVSGSNVLFLDPVAYVGDINKDGRPDIRLNIMRGANGLGALISYKVYLFNHKEGFSVVSFVDFGDGEVYDLNGDGKYEILGCIHTRFNGHSYWAYNVYEYSNGRLINKSLNYGYPLWTKHLISGNDKVIARNIPYKERMQTLMQQPYELLTK